MKDDTASHTARSVAAHRLDYERIPAPGPVSFVAGDLPPPGVAGRVFS
jgi:hypothetical protein